MKKNTCKEWTLDVPWGKLALMSWGDAASPPVFLAHGITDCAATFVYLVDLLPDTYYYVAVDFPGNGRSDPFPPGPVLTHAHLVEVVKIVVDQLKWHRFLYLAHSLGCIIGALYNINYPGRITKMVTIDLEASLGFFYFITYDYISWFKYFYSDHYENYVSNNTSTSKLYTKEEAINAVASNRNLSFEQTETILSRCMVPAEDDLYRFSWDPRVKRLVSLFISEETFFTILTKNAPPTLNFNAANRKKHLPPSCIELGEKMMEDIIKTIPNYVSINVKARHDLHITNPQDIVGPIVKFFEEDSTNFAIKAKL